MNQSTNECTRARLLRHMQAYPQAQIRDIFKYVYQSAMGCEHLLANRDAVLDYILREYESIPTDATAEAEPLDGNYSRVPLAYLRQGLFPTTLTAIFCASAKKEPNGMEALEEKLHVVRQMICEKELPFSPEEFEAALTTWRAEGCPAVRHSEEFRALYRPAYRVIANEYVKILPLLIQIDTLLQKNGKVTLAIEGGSASGKTTLAGMLKEIYGCNVFHMDDFFLRPEQRTSARLAEIGGNVDRERFLEEVLLPHSRGEQVLYRRFDCTTQSISPAKEVTPTALTVVEGAYSMHPDLAPYYDLSLFLDVSSDCQRERILRRNTPAFAKRFFEEWIPMEQIYFAETHAKERCALSISVE